MDIEPSRKPHTAMGMAGHRIAHYTLIRELGHGGQGYVYLARDDKLNREVALKILQNMQALHPKTRLRFIREAETASKLSHPGLCTIHEFGEHEGMPFIAMQYVKGTSLARKIDQAKDTAQIEDEVYVAFDTTTTAGECGGNEKDADAGDDSIATSDASPSDRDSIMGLVKMIEEVAVALDAAHEAGLIHRDIKPANIMLTDDGRPIILDFGLAHDDTSDQATLTQTGEIMGTPAYMSPEQIQRSSDRVDRRSDVYSLGVTLFECLTLTRPFSASNREKLYQAIMHDDPPPVRRLNPAIPDDLRIIVEAALEKSPDCRYQTAADFADDLRRVRQYEPILARPAGPLLKTLRWMQRKPAVATTMIILIASLMAIALTFYIKGQESRKATRRAERESREKSIALARETRERIAKEAALKEKSLALADFERLADVKKYQEAVATADELWPARPSTTPLLQKWLRDYKELSQSLPEHEASLLTLRKSADDYTEEMRLRDHAGAFKKIKSIEAALERAAAGLTQAKNEKEKSGITRWISEKRKEKDTLVVRTRKQISWRFNGDNVKRWKHEVLSELVSNLGRFCDPETGTYADVSQRLQRAQTITARSIKDHIDIWTRTTAAIKQSKKYDGLLLGPQLGLVPLGEDPQSGLHEFIHLETHSGALPTRDDSGHLSLTENTGIVLVLIPKGIYWMGSQKKDPSGQNYDPQAEIDSPLRKVEISEPFFLSKYEMTQGQWSRSPAKDKSPSFYGPGARGSGMKAPVDLRHPVEQVSWTTCTQVLARMGLKLPSEEQWEYAARAGTSSIFIGNVNDAKNVSAWGNIAGLECKPYFAAAEPVAKDAYVIHAPVGKFRGNAFGLYDILGNVWEWTSSKSGAYRIFRGGSFFGLATEARVAFRYFNTDELRNYFLGLRPCSPIQP